MKTNGKIAFTILFMTIGFVKISISQSDQLTKIIEKKRFMRVMFYNCENLFDIYNDSLTKDEEFLPDGERFWNNTKYYNKLNHITKVITAVGGWQHPELIGLCEVENRFVLEGLTKHSQLYQFEYSIIHKESPDRRGIDVALLYKKSKYTPIKNEFIPIKFQNSNSKTRDILYSCGQLKNYDTLHIFVNHWPSRWGGQLESENRRVQVAQILKQKVDSIFTTSLNANIIIMGDFNDTPANKSIKEVLEAQPNLNDPTNHKLYNLSYQFHNNHIYGTHKYQGEWAVLDQMIVSGAMLNQSSKTYSYPEDSYIFNAQFLLKPDDNYLGSKPFRTYIGFKYNGGFSDHLPIFLDLHSK